MNQFINVAGTFIVTCNYVAHTSKKDIPVLLLAPSDDIVLPPEIVMDGKDRLSGSFWLNNTSPEDAEAKYTVGSQITGTLAICVDAEEDSDDYDASDSEYSRHRVYFEAVTGFKQSKAAIGLAQLDKLASIPVS